MTNVRAAVAALVGAAALGAWTAADAIVTRWQSGDFWGDLPLPVAAQVCQAEVPGSVPQETTGEHGDYGHLYGFRCYKDGYQVGFSDTVSKYWSCNNNKDAIYWHAYAPGSLPDNASCRLNKNPPCGGVGNPVSCGTGNKYQEEVDYAAAGPSPLRFARTYNSRGDGQATALGWRWRSTFDRSLAPIAFATTAPRVWVSRPDGRQFYFTLRKNGTAVPLTPYDAAATWTTDADIADRLTRVVDGSGATLGWTYYAAATEDTEAYDAAGRLTGIATRAGIAQALAYDAQGRLGTVTDSFGRQLAFTYDTAGYLATMTDPAGGLYQFAHDAYGNPTAVTHPDATVRTYARRPPAFE